MVFMDYAYLRHNSHGPYGPYGPICVQFMIFFEKKDNRQGYYKEEMHKSIQAIILFPLIGL